MASGLPDVKNKILDGALGARGADATGIFGAVGVAANYGGGIQIFTDPGDAAEALGDGPLRDLVASSLSVAGTICYAVALEGTTPGTVGSVTAGGENTGAGSVAASGTPRNEYDVKVVIVESGALNEAVFRVEIDGVMSKKYTVPDTPGTFDIPGTGITLTFSEGTPSGGEAQFEVDDEWSFSATAPTATNAEVLAAVDTLLESAYAYEWISIAGVSASPLWASLAVKAAGAEANHRYIHFKCQARYVGDAETTSEWVAALAGDERGSTVGGRVQVYAGWVMEADPAGAVDERGLIGLGTGLSARREPHEPIDAVKYGGIPGVVEILPTDLNDGHVKTLADAGYVTARHYIGLTGTYITSGKMLAEDTSDFKLEERRRVMDKACKLVRDAQMKYLNDTVEVGADGSLEGIEMFKKISEQPLDQMVNGGEISGGTVYIDPNQDILSTEQVVTRIRITPLGKMSHIENVISYHNPLLA